MSEEVPIKNLTQILEAALFVADEPLSIDKLMQLFDENNQPSKEVIKEALDALSVHYADRGVALVEVASGYRFQARAEYADQLQRLWEKRPPRYSRALMETLALIAYRQPITRGEIEDVRGVAVSSNIIRTLMERDWVKIVGHRDVPGKPALFATTKKFLDYFNLQKLGDLPPLSELVDFEALEKQLGLQLPAPVENNEDASDDHADDSAVTQVQSEEVKVALSTDDNRQASKEKAVLQSVVEDSQEGAEAEIAVEESESRTSENTLEQV